jgi:hypothetical protein
MSKKDSRQLQQETLSSIISDASTIIYALLSIPVFSSLILTMCKLFIHTVLPKSLIKFEKDNINLLDKFFDLTTFIVKFLSKFASLYIKGIQKILSTIPKYKNLNESDRKKIAVGIYYTITIGFAIKVIKVILIKKGLSADGTIVNSLKQSILDGLKATTHDFDFDNIDSEGGEALFSKGPLAPLSSSITGLISKYLNIHEQSLNEIDFAPGFRPTQDLTIVSTVTGSDVDHLKKYVLELHRVLTANFGNDVQFEEKLKMSILPNKDKQIETTFTIIDIIDELMSKTVRENLQDIHEQLTMWSINQDLVIDFTFKIKK